jgi:hypothetical protein
MTTQTTAPTPAEDPPAPKKYKRPLPQPGDKDYVTGQPSSEEEADAIEKAEAEKYAHAKATREAEAKAREAAKAPAAPAAAPATKK